MTGTIPKNNFGDAIILKITDLISVKIYINEFDNWQLDFK